MSISAETPLSEAAQTWLDSRNPKTTPASMKIKITAEIPCDEALTAWFEIHRQYIAGETPRTYKQYVKALQGFFQKLPLKKIHIGNIRGYQEWRKQSCCATRVNAELSALQMTMREAGLWDKRIAPLYRPLPIPKKKVRQNMSEEEERRLLAVAFDKPRRRLAGHCLILMANTSMGFGELRHLRRCDVFLTDEPPFVEVNGGTKNDYRIRSIPLNFIALRSMRWIIKRWEDIGGTEPDQYILPHHGQRTEEQQMQRGHARSQPLFNEPMGHIYRAARGILKDAGLSHLDPYDMRSHCITKLLSNPNVSEQMYTEIVGHVSKKMRMRYSRQRLENKRSAMDAMCKEHVEPNARLIAFPGGKQVAKAEHLELTSRRPMPKPGSHYAPRHVETAPEPHQSMRVSEPTPSAQTPAVTVAQPRQAAVQQSRAFTSGFYITASTR